MKKSLIMFSTAALLLTSCSKTIDSVVKDVPPTQDAPATQPEQQSQYVKYTILQGQQYCDKNAYSAVNYTELAFNVKFDSSAIYTTAATSNQKDINKLFGFSDNNAQHHQFSARFGWRWSDNALRLFAYTYNSSRLSVKEIGTVAIGAENNCSIKVDGTGYIFTLNGVSETVPRTSTTVQGTGYKLYPYFGGSEMAPHQISIWIKEVSGK